MASHAGRALRPVAPLSEADAWLIAYPDQFAAEGMAPLAALRSQLDELAPEINGVHVLPFHPWSSDGGFSVIDHHEVDDRYGTWDDVAALGSTCRLMADAVVNHVSARGRWFLGYLEGDPRYARFFREVSPDDDLHLLVRPRSSSPVTRYRRADGTPVDLWTTCGPDQVDLDYREPDVVLAMADVVLGYASQGATAIRLDAVAFVGKRPGTSCVHLRETHAVVQLLRALLDELDPGVELVTETNVPHAENVSYLGADGVREAQAVYQFALPPLVLHALCTGDAGPLRDWGATLDPLPAGTTFVNFLASHDGVGVRPVEGILGPPEVERLADVCRAAGGVVNTYRRPGGAEAPYELTSTWFELCRSGHDDEAGRLRHLASHAVMLALAGVPLLYVHSLFGSRNDVSTFAVTGTGRDLNRARFGPEGPPSGTRVSSELRTMLGWRRRHRAFHPWAEQRLLPATGGLVAVERRAADGARALVVVNLGDVSAAYAVPDGGWTTFEGDRVPAEVEMAPWSSFWLTDAENRVPAG